MGLKISGPKAGGETPEAMPDFEKLIVEAETALMDGHTAKGLSLLSRLNSLFPGRPRVLNNMGVACHLEGRPRDAIKFFLEAVKADSGDRTAILNLGEAFEAEGKLEEASGIFFRFMDGRPVEKDILKALIRVDGKIYDNMISQCETMGESRFRKRDFTVSVIVSTYSSSDFIRECLEDLEAQTWADRLEVIVVDAASPQDERRVVEEFQQRYDNIRYFRTPARIGIYPAWNVAIRAATGKYILPFSTNDRLAPDACEKLASALEANPSAALAYGDTYLTDLPHQVFGRHVPSADYNGVFQWPDYQYEFLLVSCGIGPHPLWRRSVHETIGYFDGRYKAIGDQDFWLRLGRHFPMQHISGFTGLAWLTKESLSGQSTSMDEIRDIHAKYIRSYKESKIQNTNDRPESGGSGSERTKKKDSWVPVAGAQPFLPQRYTVTALVSTYNSEVYFRGCMESLVAQTLFAKGELEIIVVDSGSTQNERAIIREFQDAHPNIVYMRTQRESLYAAWNRAVMASRGKFLANANTDDRQRPDAFEIMARELDSRAVALVYSDAMYTSVPNETFTVNSSTKIWSLPDFSVRQALADCPFGCQVMWHRSLHARFGLFDESFRIAGDYEFFLKASISGGAYHIPIPLCLYFESMKNLSYGQPQQVDMEVNRFLPGIRLDPPLQAIYPFLNDDTSPQAKGMALMDFANTLMNPNARVGYPEAERNYREAMKLMVPMPELINNLALSLLLQGRKKEASDMMRDAIVRFPVLAQYAVDKGSGPEPEIIFQIQYPPLDAMPKLKFMVQQRLSHFEYRAERKKDVSFAG